MKNQAIKTLIAGAIFQLCLGIIYVWSVFVNPVTENYGWERTDVVLTAPIMLCFFVVGILCGGKISMIIGVTKTALAGGLMVAAGMLGAAFIPSGFEIVTVPVDSSTYNFASDAAAAVSLAPRAPVFLIYLLYGVIGGFGVGAGYNAALSTAQKWFPKKRGLATGISVGAFGFSTVIFAPLVRSLINNHGVQTTFFILAAIFGAATLALFKFIKTPDQVASGGGAPAPVLTGKQYTTLEMIKSSRYYLVTLSMMFGLALFFIVNPDLIRIAEAGGVDSATALGVLMFTGIANALGRICVPMMSDKIGREFAAIFILGLTALGAFTLCFAQGGLLIAALITAAFCFGGYAGLYPVITSENFGLKNIAANYGMVMVGFMLSALLFPIVINRIDDQVTKFITLGVIACVGVVLVIVLKLQKKNAAA